jgi:4-hydroxybenzoate polyprenyltransferase
MNNVFYDKPLVVDLDGSLIKTDLLHETFIKAFYKKPWVVFCIPLWLLSGKAYLKQRLANAIDLDAKHLPWNETLVLYLQEQHGNGREIILCSGSWHSLAEKVAKHFPFFSAAYGTDLAVNLTGKNKADFLIKKYGDKNFSYVGNEKKDLSIWKHACSAVIVSDSASLKEKAEAACLIEKVFPSDRMLSVKTVLKQMRIHQWVKNTLVFVPLITSHQVTDLGLFFSVLLVFVAYNFCASGTYILNDLSDLESDRKNSKKRFRPLAAGNLSIFQGLIFAFLLLLASFLIALQLPASFAWCLLAYTFITLCYSFKLKRIQTVDITVLASLYTLRIISGAAAINILPSFWLLAFSMFIFLCLAIIKRLSEIINAKDKYDKKTKLSGRGYYVTDLQVLMNLSTASGMLSVLVLAMYINSPEIIALYSEPYTLWLLCPLFGYWIIRILIMASRGEVDEDPILFAIKDSRSWVTGIIILLIVSFASI